VGTTCHEEATVTGIATGGRVEVTVERGEACHSCAAQGACKTLGGQKRDLVLLVGNELDAAPGDRVRLTIAESAVVKASAVLYLLPALGLIAGAAAGWALAVRQGWPTDLPALIGAAVGLVVGLLAGRLVGGRLARQKAFVPQLTAITGRARRPDTGVAPGPSPGTG
jgi:sigma-E factor negative regulatory protein RseC